MKPARVYEIAIAALALGLFLAFLAIIALRVQNGTVLAIVFAITGAMAAYDFWKRIFGKR